MRTRGLYFAAALGLLTASLVLIPSTTASAVSPVPGPPGPLNGLPSTLGAAAGTGISRGDHLSALLYRFAKSPTFAAAVKAQAAGVATTAQAATVTAGVANYAVPVSKMAGLAKFAGPVGVAITGFSMGLSAGQLGLKMFGFDAEGQVCGGGYGDDGFGVVGLLAGVDCGAWEMTLEAQAVANNDAINGVAGGQICSQAVLGAVSCFTVLGVRSIPLAPASYGLCITMSGPFTGSPKQVAYYKSQADGLLYSFGPIGPLTFAGTPTGGAPQILWDALPSCPAGTRTVVATSSGHAVDSTNPLAVVEYGFRCNSSCAGYTTQTTTVHDTYGDPSRTLKCTIVGSNGTSYSASSVSFHESDGVIPDVVCPGLPEGVNPATITVEEVGGGVTNTLWSDVATPEWLAGDALAPECAGGTCLLELRKGTLSCFQSPADCAGWFADPNKGSTYSCSYGTHAVDLSECTVYAPTFEPTAQGTGNVYGDPSTGEPVTAPEGLNPGTDEGYFGAAAQDPSTPRVCFPEGWAAFNPLEWVMRPVQCAIEWAFIPSPATVATFQDAVGTAYEATPAGKVSTAISAQAWPAIAPDGCEGFTLSLSWMKQGAFVDAPFPSTVSLLRACPGEVLYPFAVFANLVLSAGIVAVAFRTWPALVGRMFTYGGVDG